MIILVSGCGIAWLIDRAGTSDDWRRRLHFSAFALLSLGIVFLGRDVVRPYQTRGDQQLRAQVRDLIAAAASDPIFVVQAELDTPATLRWYLPEHAGGSVYGDAPTALALKDDSSAWVINCLPTKAHLAVDV